MGKEQAKYQEGVQPLRIVDKWGPLPVASVRAREIYAFRDAYSDAPVMAIRLVVVLRTLIAFGVPREYIDRDPATEHVNEHGDAVLEAYRSTATGARGEQKAFVVAKKAVLEL
jgi:hypothetical protein